MNQSTIPKISTFRAIYTGLRGIPRVCSIVVKLSALFFAILYLISGPQVPSIMDHYCGIAYLFLYIPHYSLSDRFCGQAFFGASVYVLGIGASR